MVFFVGISSLGPRHYEYKLSALALRSHRFTVDITWHNRISYAKTFFLRMYDLWNFPQVFCFQVNSDLKKRLRTISRWNLGSLTIIEVKKIKMKKFKLGEYLDAW